MTKLLERALEAARRLSNEEQDAIARAILGLVGNEPEPEEVQREHLDAVMEGLQQADSGQLADAADVEAAFKRFGR